MAILSLRLRYGAMNTDQTPPVSSRSPRGVEPHNQWVSCTFVLRWPTHLRYCLAATNRRPGRLALPALHLGHGAVAHQRLRSGVLRRHVKGEQTARNIGHKAL